MNNREGDNGRVLKHKCYQTTDNYDNNQQALIKRPETTAISSTGGNEAKYDRALSIRHPTKDSHHPATMRQGAHQEACNSSLMDNVRPRGHHRQGAPKRRLTTVSPSLHYSKAGSSQGGQGRRSHCQREATRPPRAGSPL